MVHYFHMQNESRSPWIFVLLLATSVLLIGVFLIALMFIINDLRGENDQVPQDAIDMVSEDEEEGATTTPDTESPSETSPVTLKFASIANLPAYSYPNGWHITVEEQLDPSSQYPGYRPTATSYVSNVPIQKCSACDGLPAPIILTVYDRTTETITESVADQILRTLGPEFYKDVNDISTELPNGTYTQITATALENGFYGISFPLYYIVFESDNHVFVAQYTALTEDEEILAGWELMKQSFNFSQL